MLPEITLDPSTILWIQALLAIIVALAVKDIATEFVQGLLFKYQPHFKQGDHVIVDGDRGILVSVGYRTAVFRIEKDDGMIAWRYVPNSRIRSLRLEKIVEDNTVPDLLKRVQALENSRRSTDRRAD